MGDQMERRKIRGLRWHLIQAGISVLILFGLAPRTLSPALAETPLTSVSVHGVTGRVTYSGPPEEKRYEVSKYHSPRHCRESAPSGLVDGNFRVLKTIEVGAEGGLKGAIVAVTDILDLKFMAEYSGTDVVVNNCSFSLLTGVVVKGRSLRLENQDADPQDPIFAKGVHHDGHAYEVARQSFRTIFNVDLPEKGSQLDQSVNPRNYKYHDELSLLLRCDWHGWEQAYFLPVTNPYYTTVADDGSFEIKGVSPGRHTIVVWHPFAGRTEADIYVDELGSAQVNFELSEKGRELGSIF